LPALACLGLFVVVAGAGVSRVAGQAQSPDSPAPSGALACAPLRSAHPTGFPCELDDVLTRQFTPLHMPAGTYRAYRTTAPIETVVRAFRALWGAGAPAGAWTVADADPLGTFGRVAPYDQGKVARLYGGRPARVARGPIVDGGRTVASITLVSPYPSQALLRLEPGTLILDFRIPSRSVSQ
jgi:hypothetical protein